jgi:hypothetical protein
MCNLWQIFFSSDVSSALISTNDHTCIAMKQRLGELFVVGLLLCFSGSEHMMYGLLALRNCTSQCPYPLKKGKKNHSSSCALHTPICPALFFLIVLGGNLSEKSGSI